MQTEILQEIGLTQGEIKVYLALLRLKSSSSGGLAKQSGVSRSKIYEVLEKIEKKGLASHVDRNGVRYFQAVEPAKIGDYLRQREEELKKLTRSFEASLPSLEAYYREGGSAHSVTFYEGVKGLKVAHEHTYQKLKRGEEYFVLSVPQYTPWEKITYWEHDHLRRAKAGISCKMLFCTDTDRKLMKNRNGYPLCEARYMPLDIRGPAYFEIFKDTTLIIIPSETPITIEIVSQDIADSFKSYFDEFWKRSRPFK